MYHYVRKLKGATVDRLHMKVFGGSMLLASLFGVGILFVAAAEETTWVDTTNTDFAATTLAQTVVQGSGEPANVQLALGAARWRTVTSPVDIGLTGVDASSETNAWAVGDNGTILRWQGAEWIAAKSPTTNTLWFVATLSATDAWAVGDNGTILRWNGTSWALVASPTTEHLLAVTMVTASDGWIVGENGAILRWDGTAWKNVASPTIEHLYEVVLRSASDGWIVGGGGTILRWDGTSWVSVASGETHGLLSVAFPDANTAVAVGEAGTVLRFDGSAWSTVAINGIGRLETVTMTSATQGWIGGENGALFTTSNGTSWTEAANPTNTTLSRIALTARDAGWAVGASGTILQLQAAYAASGTVTGKARDAGGAISAASLVWNATTPSATEVKFQLASNDDATTWKYVGADGTEKSYFTTAAGIALGAPHKGKRYLRYRAFLSTSDATTTPLLNDVTLTATVERGPTLPAPELVTPADGTAVITLPLTFSWSVVPGATSYTIQIDTKKLFPAPFAAATVTDPTYTYALSLAEGTYFWRARAENASGVSPWSATHTFTVDRTPPAVPTNLLPAEGATVGTTTPSFTWKTVSDAAAYEFQLNTSEKFIFSVVVSTTVQKPTYTVTSALTPGITYYWRVRSRDSAGNRSAWTKIQTFTVVAAPEEKKEALDLEALRAQPTTGQIEAFPLTLTSPTLLNTDRPTLIGTVSRASVIAAVEIDGQIVGITTVDGNGAFTFAMPIRLPDGEHTVRLVVDGIASLPVSFTIDTLPPARPATVVVELVRQQPSTVDPTKSDVLITLFGAIDPAIVEVGVTDARTTEILGKVLPFAGDLRMSLERAAQPRGTSYILAAFRDAAGNYSYFPLEYEVTDAVISYECSDGKDNDGDGLADYLNDPDCASLVDNQEQGTFIAGVLSSTVLANVRTTIAEATAATLEATQEVAEKVIEKTVEQTVVVAEATERAVTVAAPIAVPALTAAAPVAIAVNPVTASSIPALPAMAGQWFTWLLSALGIRKKRKNPWGVVYDAITKDPIPLAIVRLFDARTKQLLVTQVTDNEGRFEFLVKPGTYTLGIVKTSYVFPSKLVLDTTDGDILDVYHGGTITITSTTQHIHVSIPLDPEDPAKRRAAGARAVIARAHRLLARASLPFLVVGTGVSIVIYAFAQTQYNLLMLLLYVALASYQTHLLPKIMKAFGTIFDATTLQPVPLAIVNLIDPQYQRVLKTRLSDYQGRFTFLPDPGSYQLKVTKTNYQFPSKRVRAIKKYHHLYRGEALTIVKKKAIIAVDVPLDPVRSRHANGSASGTSGRLASNGVDPLTHAPPRRRLSSHPRQ